MIFPLPLDPWIRHKRRTKQSKVNWLSNTLCSNSSPFYTGFKKLCKGLLIALQSRMTHASFNTNSIKLSIVKWWFLSFIKEQLPFPCSMYMIMKKDRSIDMIIWSNRPIPMNLDQHRFDAHDREMERIHLCNFKNWCPRRTQLCASQWVSSRVIWW